MRAAIWGAASVLLLVPLLAMQLTGEVAWTVTDFAFAGALLFGLALALDLAVTRTGDRTYGAAVALALSTALILIWMNGAVGLIGSERHPANALYWSVPLIGAVGAAISRLRARGMAAALAAMALAQALVPLSAGAFGMPIPSGETVEITALTGLFVGLWLAAAWLFRKAALATAGGAQVRPR
ncbi:hypothetical protein ACUN0C_02885 [Faunimonas sp. B44]|uniref:hypothetical protein n=1 Tax=Faunimonas sp. B44 TaxID=3461493 RepID=UPI00404399D2